ncbi:MAG: hypothetical protein GYB66_02855 [Chloroflexi bacterium]|nr:hypothetical protein [Chloroflexota bacterium]
MKNQSTSLPPTDELLLSAYLDGALEGAEKEALEERLAEDENLRSAFEGLRETVSLLRSLPPIKAPRDFTLDPALFTQQTPDKPQDGKVIGLPGAFGRQLQLVATLAAALVIIFGAIVLYDLSQQDGTADSPSAPDQGIGVAQDVTREAGTTTPTRDVAVLQPSPNFAATQQAATARAEQRAAAQTATIEAAVERESTLAGPPPADGSGAAVPGGGRGQGGGAGDGIDEAEDFFGPPDEDPNAAQPVFPVVPEADDIMSEAEESSNTQPYVDEQQRSVDDADEAAVEEAEAQPEAAMDAETDSTMADEAAPALDAAAAESDTSGSRRDLETVLQQILDAVRRLVEQLQTYSH